MFQLYNMNNLVHKGCNSLYFLLSWHTSDSYRTRHLYNYWTDVLWLVGGIYSFIIYFNSSLHRKLFFEVWQQQNFNSINAAVSIEHHDLYNFTSDIYTLYIYANYDRRKLQDNMIPIVHHSNLSKLILKHNKW